MNESYTAQDLTAQSLQNILSYLAPDFATSGLSTWMSGMLASPMLRMLGIQNPASTMLASNMTNSGVYSGMMNSRINQMSSSFASQISHNMLSDRLRDLEYTRLGPYSEWRKTNEGKSAADYEDLVDSEVDAWFRRPGFESLYSAANQALGFDPTSLAASKHMGQAAQNVLKRGLYVGGRNYASLGLGALGQVFKSTNGNYLRFNSQDWNGFNQGSVAEIAELVTRETDILDGVEASGGDLSGKARSAGERLKQKVKDLTAALEPLKDVFGNDVSKMVSTIESLTGQSVSSMSTDRLRSLSTNIVDRTNSGIYSVNEMQTFSLMMNSRMESMPGLSPYNYMSGASQAFRVLDMLKAGGQPDSMTNRQWQSAAMDFVSKTTNSGAADLYAKAYSVWAHNRKAGEDTSTEAFNAKVAEFGPNIDKRRAWLSAAGLSYAAEADEGMGYSFYRKAIESGAAGKASGYAMLDKMISLGSSVIGLNQGFMKATGLTSSSAAATLYNQIVGAVSDNTAIRNMSESERIKYLTDAGYDEETATRLSTGLQYMESRQNTKHVLNLVSLRSSEEKMAQATARSAARRERLSKIQTKLLDPDNGIIPELISGGLSLSKLKKRLKTSGLIDKNGADPDHVEALLAAGESGGRDLLDASNTEGRTTFASSFFNYAMSGEAFGNTTFQEALNSYNEDLQALKSIKDPDKRAEVEDRMKLNRNVMIGFMDIGEKEMEAFLNSSSVKGEKGKHREENKQKLAHILERSRKGDYKVSTKDAVKMETARNMVAQLGSQAAVKAFETYDEKYWVDANNDGRRSFGEKFMEYYNANYGKNEDTNKALDQVKDIIQGLGGIASPGLESILTGLSEAINKLVAVLTGENKDKTAVTNKNNIKQAAAEKRYDPNHRKM